MLLGYVTAAQDRLAPDIIMQFEARQLEVGYTTFALLAIGKKVRVGTAVCSERDRTNSTTGKRIALRRAMEQFDLCYEARRLLWAHFFRSQWDADSLTVFNNRFGGMDLVRLHGLETGELYINPQGQLRYR